jgi:hypothetical protein
MDWTMAAVYLCYAAFVIYVAGLLRGLYYEFTHSHRAVPPQEEAKQSGASLDPIIAQPNARLAHGMRGGR